MVCYGYAKIENSCWEKTPIQIWLKNAFDLFTKRNQMNVHFTYV